MGKMFGLSDEQIKVLKTESLNKNFVDKEHTVIEYTPQVTKDAEGVSEVLSKLLRSYFNDIQIVNLTLIIGLMNVFKHFNSSLRVELEK